MALFHVQFFSESLGLSCSMNVILPQQARGQIGLQGAGGARPASTLYLLHGLSDDHSIWLRRTSIERYAAPLPLAVVMPEVHRSFYQDMVHGSPYWTFISEELPALVRQFFHLPQERKHTFAAGLSMGGYGAFRLALSHPDRFAAAASLSGAVDIANEIGENPAWLSADRNNMWRTIFGDPPRVKDTPSDLLHLASRVASLPRQEQPRLYQCCGTEDPLYRQNQNFKKHAGTLGLDLSYEEGPGGHEWGSWDVQIQKVLAWLPLP
jgi:S-formylglutathione hydrolase FrmB